MRSPIEVLLARKETVGDEPIPDDISLSELAEQVVRGKVKLSPSQMRMLIELLPFHLPKLSAVAVGHLTGQDFASRLDKAIAASEKAKVVKMIEATAIENPDSEND